MKHIKLFEAFVESLNEGQIQVFAPGNPWKKVGSGITWPGVADWLTKYSERGRHIILGVDLSDRGDFEPFTADPSFRSKPLGTWKDKTLPKFYSKHPNYDEVEFDFLEIVPNEEKPREPWIKVADKNGMEFLVPPFSILDIVQGGSVIDKIFPGEAYMIGDMRGNISDYRNKTVYITLQNGEEREYSLTDWKAKHFASLDENNSSETL